MNELVGPTTEIEATPETAAIVMRRVEFKYLLGAWLCGPPPFWNFPVDPREWLAAGPDANPPVIWKAYD